MREGETEFVRDNFAKLGAKSFAVEDAREQFLGASRARPNPRRSATSSGSSFVEVQQRILESEHYLDGQWILGQGTIIPTPSNPEARPRPT